MTGPAGRALLELVAEIRPDELPKPVLEVARLAVLDWWGVTVAGADEPVARLVRRVTPAADGAAAVLGTAGRAAPVTAALLNGVAAHALDYDDTHLDLPGHVTAPILPGLVALAEARRLGGRALLVAFVAGVEVMCRVARALAPGHYRAGWHATATVGRLGGAAAAARLLGLSADHVEAAVGLAAAQLGGVQESFGTMAKPFQVGRAASDALLAALLAAEGMTAGAGLLASERWARRLSPDWAPARLDEGLGRGWALPEVHFKRYPCCFATHATIRGLLALAPRPAAPAIEGVDLEVCPTTLQVANQVAPRSGLAGKFSVSYCAAVALARGRVVEADFTDEAVADPAIQALAARIRPSAAPDFDETRARATIRLAGGGRLDAAGDLRAGGGPDALREDLERKFLTLVGPRVGAARAARLAAAIERLDEVDDVGELTA